jgi:hypothetical protein
MHSKTPETDHVGFGRALAELLVVAIVALSFAFAADWALRGLYHSANRGAGMDLHTSRPLKATPPPRGN